MTQLLRFPPNATAAASAFAIVELHDKDTAILQHIWVDSGSRKAGAGAGLVEQIVADLRQRRISFLLTHPSPGRRKTGALKINAIPSDDPAYPAEMARLQRFLVKHGFRRFEKNEIDEHEGRGTWARSL